MVIDEIDDLRPGPNQVLVETVACGICGSDLHTVDHAHLMASTAQEVGMGVFMFDPDVDLVMGHETSVRVLEIGADVAGIRPGTDMTAMPILTASDGRPAVPGYDNVYPGGFSERMLLDPGALIPVPNGLDPVLAALTEPMAVGLHAVNQSAAAPGRPAIVIGAGPVGLAVIAALRIKGIELIVASDFSATRRRMAAVMGAHVVVDPGDVESRQDGFDLSVDVWAEHASAENPPVIFEAVGVPGMIETAMTGAPDNSEIIVVGVCMEADSFRPIMGIYKRLSLRFVLGWSPVEFTESLHNLAEGRIVGETLVTDQVELDGVPDAFDALADPDQHVKILVRPNGLI